MVVETPAKVSVTTSLVCLQCPLSMFGRDFEVDLVFFALEWNGCDPWYELVGV